MLTIYHGDNLPILKTMPAGSFDLIYVDPPFNTGKAQSHTTTRSVRDEEGNRVGYGGVRYRTTRLATKAFTDRFEDYLGFLMPRLEQAHRLLTPTGSLFVHLDYREVHYVKCALDSVFGRANFINEIIWAYDYGGRSTSRWSAKHDNILWYARDGKNYTFNYDAIDRVPYMAPKLVSPEKALRGKTPTDTWWHTIVSPGSKEKTGYPAQKPLGLLERLVKVHSRPGDRLLDFFAGSGSFGEAALGHDRSAVLIDENPEAIEIMLNRLAFAEPTLIRHQATLSKAAGRVICDPA